MRLRRRVAVSYGQFDVFGGRDIWEGFGSCHRRIERLRQPAGLAVYYRKHDGYSQNTLLDERLDDQDNYAVRGSLLFQPTDALEIRVGCRFQPQREHGQSRRAVDDPSFPGFGAVVRIGTVQRQCARERCTLGLSGKIRTQPGSRRASTIRLGGGHTLTYLSAVRYGDFNGRYSLVGTRSPPSLTDAANGQHEKYTGITQDLRLSSSGRGTVRCVGSQVCTSCAKTPRSSTTASPLPFYRCSVRAASATSSTASSSTIRRTSPRARRCMAS